MLKKKNFKLFLLTSFLAISTFYLNVSAKEPPKKEETIEHTSEEDEHENSANNENENEHENSANSENENENKKEKNKDDIKEILKNSHTQYTDRAQEFKKRNIDLYENKIEFDTIIPKDLKQPTNHVSSYNNIITTNNYYESPGFVDFLDYFNYRYIIESQENGEYLHDTLSEMERNLLIKLHEETSYNFNLMNKKTLITKNYFNINYFNNNYIEIIEEFLNKIESKENITLNKNTILTICNLLKNEYNKFKNDHIENSLKTLSNYVKKYATNKLLNINIPKEKQDKKPKYSLNKGLESLAETINNYGDSIEYISSKTNKIINLLERIKNMSEKVLHYKFNTKYTEYEINSIIDEIKKNQNIIKTEFKKLIDTANLSIK